MKRLILAALAAFTFVTEAQAHAHLAGSVPANESVVTASPPSIQLRFSHAVRLTALTVESADGERQALEGLPAEAAESLAVVAPKLAPGKYVVSWRALSKDNHVMSGKFSFTLDPHKSAGTH
jgi:methionine-rich copper-binding protein CopC